MDQTAEKVLSYLEDEESKEIYRNWIAYRDTYDYSYIQDGIVNRYRPEYRESTCMEISTELCAVLERYKQIVVAGVGQRGKSLIRMLQNGEYYIACAVDNGFQGEFSGVRVVRPENAELESACVVISLLNKSAATNMADQIIGEGVKKEDIYYLNDFVEGILIAEDKQYFDENILSYEEKECFVDCGAYDLDTSKRYIEACKRNGVKSIKIYAFEPDAENFRNCEKM